MAPVLPRMFMGSSLSLATVGLQEDSLDATARDTVVYHTLSAATPRLSLFPFDDFLSGCPLAGLAKTSPPARSSMSFVHLALASTLFAFGSQAVHARFASIQFSPLEQCGNFTVAFSGGKLPQALPLSLTVVPFNLTPIRIGIADMAWDNTTLKGAAFTFLPLPAGTQFVASLDDANGHSAAFVSDVIKVQSSDNTTCLPTIQTTPARYTFDESISQCRDFHVTYDASTVSTPPKVRAFLPRTFAFPLAQDNSTSTAGNTSFVANLFRGQQTVLMASDDTGYLQSTNLLSVEGDSLSPKGCLPQFPASNQTTQMVANNSTASGTVGQGATKTTLSKTAIVAIVLVCVGTISGLMGAMIWFLCRERRRVKMKEAEDIEDSFLIVSGKRGSNRRTDGEKTFSQTSQDLPSAPPMAITYFSSTSPVPRAPPLTLQRGSRTSDIRVSGADRGSNYSGYSRHSSGFIRDPVYTDANLDLLEPTSASYASSSVPTRGGRSTPAGLPISQIPVPIATPSPTYIAPLRVPTVMIERSQGLRSPRSPRSPTDSLSSDEIEHILDMATMYGAPTSPLGSVRSDAYRDSIMSASGYGGRSDRADENATIASVSSQRMGTFLRPSPASTPMRMPSPNGLLTPDTARGPPLVPLPSSPVPSPLTSPTGSQFALAGGHLSSAFLHI
ncbi:hypothetical protein BDY19DRAFT_995473 [Irpex rosettiformis]|uniref:Uncharacterized protein n=1 Tax=Irpex rosettiformis TaxID=378272 RepID=A0ACB8TZ06_9APHY|nr:hypothetical protein BDY19DRAFT_995473 [Irpex rosettiformis]